MFSSLLICYLCILTVQSYTVEELKCLVCERTTEEIKIAVDKLNPELQVDSGGYRLDSKGNINKKTVSVAKSEVFLSETLDEICPKMDDYVRATWKDTGGLTLIKLIGADGKMSSLMSEVDIIQDADLNKSLKFYCESMLEEYEDEIIEKIIKKPNELTENVCKIYCKNYEKSEL